MAAPSGRIKQAALLLAALTLAGCSAQVGTAPPTPPRRPLPPKRPPPPQP